MSDKLQERIERQAEVAKTIREQIKAADRRALMAWGAEKFMVLVENNQQRGGLQFWVSGLKMKGKVVIKLMADDTYTVDFWEGATIAHMENIKTAEGVYCDNLMEVIDETIER